MFLHVWLTFHTANIETSYTSDFEAVVDEYLSNRKIADTSEDLVRVPSVLRNQKSGLRPA